MPDWLMQLIWMFPEQERYDIFSALDSRSRLFANDFQQELLDLQGQLYTHATLKMRVDCLTSYLLRVNPAIAPRIFQFEDNAERARTEGMESAMRGFSLSRLVKN